MHGSHGCQRGGQGGCPGGDALELGLKGGVQVEVEGSWGLGAGQEQGTARNAEAGH